jgi:hypothetical protein
VDGESTYPFPRSERLCVLYASYIMAIIFIYDVVSIITASESNDCVLFEIYLMELFVRQS